MGYFCAISDPVPSKSLFHTIAQPFWCLAVGIRQAIELDSGPPDSWGEDLVCIYRRKLDQALGELIRAISADAERQIRKEFGDEVEGLEAIIRPAIGKLIPHWIIWTFTARCPQFDLITKWFGTGHYLREPIAPAGLWQTIVSRAKIIPPKDLFAAINESEIETKCNCHPTNMGEATTNALISYWENPDGTRTSCLILYYDQEHFIWTVR